ncbi:MAG: restriction endonuclease subunit R, partial [Chloroflexota bacterium]|nr:restriction endonuclease subunit R [Chloroflexota bacterium]
MVRRVCRELGTKRNIIVLNDEAHHCYQSRPDEVPASLVEALPAAVTGKLTGEEKKEAEQLEREARVWISGLEAIKAKIGIRTVYDLSATPFFLRGSGYGEGTLFPWVVSDFSLIDAIEAGIVKVPRVPVADDAMTGELPTYRDLWLRIRDGLPKKSQAVANGREPVLPAELEGALASLYGHYELAYRAWEARADELGGSTPPVFIVVCNNTAVSKLVFDHVAGWEKALSDGSSVLVPGHLPVFSNVVDGRWVARPNTILVDSRQLESGEAMADDFKKVAAREIVEFKAEYARRFPGRDAEELTDEDLLREVMNTVGKPGKLGEGVRCVVSVSMLTEGWDANTVTHILGVRAFGTQLLCEQVVGRGLRRMSYAAGDDGMFAPEYAEVYGVPFSFIPASGTSTDPPARPSVTRVRALEDRSHLEITFPRVVGYRYDLPAETLVLHAFGPDAAMILSPEDVPTHVENAPIVGEASIHSLDDLRARRMQEVAFRLARLTLETYFKTGGAERPWLFPSLLGITKRWLAECIVCKDNAFPQLLLLAELAHGAADRLHQAIAEGTAGEKRLLPILRPYDATGSTTGVVFDTIKPANETDPAKCHVSHVVGDSSWEFKLAQTLEGMGEVVCYVKNQGLGFTVPYTLDGDERSYVPDFVVRVDDGQGREDLLNLIVEVSGQAKKDKAEKVRTARQLWVPAVNNHGGFGRWAFVEMTDPWDAKNAIRAETGVGAVTTW